MPRDSYVQNRLILVIGATGAQGQAVIDSLLAPSSNGEPSPYAIRALTRDASSKRAQQLSARGVECVEGALDDLRSVVRALDGVYGAWVNTDGFTVGEMKELYFGIRIFELAKQNGRVRHYVWSSLSIFAKAGNYDPQYRCDHYDGKARVADWMRSQPSVTGADGMSWSVVTSGPYMEMLNNLMFGPIKRRPDGTFVFAAPVGNGHVPMIALSDLGFFARYTFDHREETSGKELKIASEMVGWDHLKATFEKVTGNKAEIVHQTVSEWFMSFDGVDDPLANERGRGYDGSTTWRENFVGWWSMWRDDKVSRDMEWVRKVHPGGQTLESWMRATRYAGDIMQQRNFLKNTEDGKTISPKWSVIARL